MATAGEKQWPRVGNFVAASGEKPMAIDIRGGADGRLLVCESPGFRSRLSRQRWHRRGDVRRPVGLSAGQAGPIAFSDSRKLAEDFTYRFLAAAVADHAPG
jgi:hypothetical protein